MQSSPTAKSKERSILNKVIDRSRNGKGGPIGPFNPYQKIVCLVKNEEGYKNLCTLSSLSWEYL